MSPIPRTPPTPDYLPPVLIALADNQLLERVSTAFQAVIIVTDGKKIALRSPRTHPELYSNLIAAWNEATRRGYRASDLGDAIKSLGVDTGFLRMLHEQLGKPESWNFAPDLAGVTWQQFEQLIAKLHSLGGDDCVVTIDERIVDRTTGTPRQVDVTLRFRKSFYDFLVVLECRHQKASVTIGDVEAFVKKLEDVRGHRGVMVTSSDFDSGAVAKAAFHGIELCTLSQAHDLSWGDHVREVMRALPLPVEVTFDPLVQGAFADAPSGSAAMSFAELRLTDAAGRDLETLASLLARLSVDILRRHLSLPVRVSVEFNPAATLAVDRFGLAAAVRHIEATFRLEMRAETRVFQKPTITRRYKYQNISRGETLLFPTDDQQS